MIRYYLFIFTSDVVSYSTLDQGEGDGVGFTSLQTK